jgi:hypothetical protein
MMNDLNLEGLSDKQRGLFAVRCARRVQYLMTDPRSVAALDVAERHAKGEATDEELAKARSAAYAAWDAARAAAEDAAEDAAVVARATAWAAARAAWAAAWDAARVAEKAEQQKILDEIRQEQM